MLRSLSSRLLVVYLAVILALLVALTVIIASIYQSIYYQQRTQALLAKAQELADITAISRDNLGPGMAVDYILSELYRNAGTQFDAAVWYMDVWGTIYMTRSGVEGSETFTLTNDEREYCVRVMGGETIVERGRFFGRFARDVISVGVPIVYRENGIIGGIFLHSKVEAAQADIWRIYRSFGWALLAIFLVGAAIIYMVARYITDPLKRINSAVNRLARGDFSRRVDVKWNDEVGQLGKNFNAMADELQQQEDLRRGFVANVSHELRSPLTSIQGFAQGMMDGTIAPQDNQKYLGVIVGETRRLNKLISELLDLAQIESGKFPLNIQVFDINESLRRALIRFEEGIDRKELYVEVDFRQEKAMVQADQDRIDQVITNLIDNAVKFSQKGGTLGIWTHIAEDKILVGVRDTGDGIAAEDQPYIWERFYKADKAHTGREGTGLGLSIVKRILDQHGETISIQSKPGSGTMFVFSLPRAAQGGAEKTAPAQKLSAGLADGDDITKK